MIKTVIFDLDGTLIDTEKYYIASGELDQNLSNLLVEHLHISDMRLVMNRCSHFVHSDVHLLRNI